MNGGGCPVDSAFWRAVLLERALEILDEAASVRRIAVDLEIYTGSITHYIEGPCCCAPCNADFAAISGETREAYQLARMTAILTGLLAEFHAIRPGVEIGIFDLDKDADVHRAMIRALRHANIPTLWLPPEQLYGPYVILGSQEDYWMNIEGSNRMQ